MSHMTRIVAVIPAFNEEKSIANIILLTKRYVDHVIVCNDGSSDNTANIVSKLGVCLIHNSKRKGKGNALRTLFKEALKYDPEIIITIDADGQHNPSDIPKLIKPLMSGESDIVVGSRFLDNSNTNISFIRSVGLRIINFLQKSLFHNQVKDSQSGFRAFSKKSFIVVTESDEEGYGIESEQLIIASKHMISTSEVPVKIKYIGLQNTSKKNFILHGFEIVQTLFKLFLKNVFSIAHKKKKK